MNKHRSERPLLPLLAGTYALGLVTVAACTRVEAPPPEEPASPTRHEPDLSGLYDDYHHDPRGIAPPALVPLRDVPLALDDGPAPEALRLHTVIEGACPWLRLSLVGEEAYVHWEFGGAFARVRQDGGLEPLRVEQGRPRNSFTIAAVEGTWPNDLWVRFDESITRLSRSGGPSYAWRRDGVWSAATEDRLGGLVRATRLHPWRDGAVLGESRYGVAPTFSVVRGGDARIEFAELRGKMERCVRREADVGVFSDGTLYVVGSFCRHTASVDRWDFVAARWTSGGPVIDELPHPRGAWQHHELVAATSVEAMHIAATFRAEPDSSDYTTLTSLAGATWSEPAVFVGFARALAVDRDGTPWLVAGRQLHHRALDGTWERVVAPKGVSIEDIGGLAGAVAWLRTSGGGLWLRPGGGRFVRVELPAPADPSARFTVEQVRVAGSDVWVEAKYRAGDRDHRALLRNGPVHPAHSCSTPAADSR